MSGSETGGAVMTTREPFTVASHSQPVMQNMRLAYSADGAAVYKPVGSSPTPQSAASGGDGTNEGQATGSLMPHNLNVNLGETVKKKRGRPRKYGPDGTMALALMPTPATATIPQAAGTFSPPSHPTPTSGGPVSPSSSKKGRGRPPGSSKKQQMEALGSAGVGFTPHIITVKAGEDVSSKIMSFSQHGPRAVCVLSANGAISNVTLRQAATSGGTATYEGRFEILSLSGSFLLTEVGGQRSRTGGLSVSLAGPDGRVLGGCVAGLLTAASPVQVIVGSFFADGRKESKPVNHVEPLSAPPKTTPGAGATGASSPPSRGTLSESSGGPGSPLNHSTGACNSNPQGMLSMPWR
ncbi:AT-hook motif nuclear-localized protein 10-like [Actinidia eriantha]|uniref:AT-hook motif nuclear-localized protein 10-like n=1 Tax=Actinidia eriantha TaxID=165200 RepID=UPI002586CA79|nr:AT-hook motif nuclear-localized protein 10-like [Actinidia eriantha]XP_057489980.1 AT-hook motif nuclear-localized protein 10-like [Actinidia eriantha]XP_057489981.1 AT-hook motif nuclear-localized protein 10-like [Actinidia eriantha]